MQEKLSIERVYINAFRYIVTHLGAFAFLTIFYFLGSLMPMFMGTTSFKIFMIPYYYLFLYFAAGCYYKQQILWDRQIFFAATFRFLTAALLFVAVLSLSSYIFNLGFGFISTSFIGGKIVVNLILKNPTWKIAKYSFMFILVIVFFIIPSFAFVSEITGKSRSLLMSYAKTKGNFIQISLIIIVAFLILLFVTILFLKFFNPFIAELARAIVLVFITIIYFKMYDFFYYPPVQNKPTKTKKNTKPEQKEILLAVNKKEKKNADQG